MVPCFGVGELWSWSCKSLGRGGATSRPLQRCAVIAGHRERANERTEDDVFGRGNVNPPSHSCQHVFGRTVMPKIAVLLTVPFISRGPPPDG